MLKFWDCKQWAKNVKKFVTCHKPWLRRFVRFLYYAVFMQLLLHSLCCRGFWRKQAIQKGRKLYACALFCMPKKSKLFFLIVFG